MKLSNVIRKNKYLVIIFLIVFCIILYAAIFKTPFLFTPLRYAPDKMVVYQYGQTFTLAPGDEEFEKIYKKLRKTGMGTLDRFFKNCLIQDSHKGPGFNLSKYYFQYGLAVNVIYDEPVQAQGIGVVDAAYNEVLFMLDYPTERLNDPNSEEYDVRNQADFFAVYYRSYADSFIEKDTYFFNFCFIGYSYPESAAKYLKNLDLTR